MGNITVVSLPFSKLCVLVHRNSVDSVVITSGGILQLLKAIPSLQNNQICLFFSCSLFQAAIRHKEF